MQHVAFTLTEARLEEARARLERAGVPYLGPINVGVDTFSIYFFDPNGIRLEFSCQRGDGAEVHVVERWAQTKAEALADLRTLSDDAEWLASVVAHLPDRR
jgi:hypothetical protein